MHMQRAHTDACTRTHQSMVSSGQVLIVNFLITKSVKFGCFGYQQLGGVTHLPCTWVGIVQSHAAVSQCWVTFSVKEQREAT